MANSEKKIKDVNKTNINKTQTKKVDTNSEKETKTQTKSKTRTIPYLITSIIAIIIILVLIITLYNFNPTSFATFKSNYNSAQRIAVVSQYINSSTYANISQCSTDIVNSEISSLKRNASTIDFYVINATSCTYAPNGLGHVLNPVTTNASSCEKSINSEPSISLNFSTSNYTVITPDHMIVYGTQKYFGECPIAISMI
ncbi:MAG: hypothetical protein QXD23_02880 [Candidatus Micrarchaeaceae archaeon]